MFWKVSDSDVHSIEKKKKYLDPWAGHLICNVGTVLLTAPTSCKDEPRVIVRGGWDVSVVRSTNPAQ